MSGPMRSLRRGDPVLIGAALATAALGLLAVSSATRAEPGAGGSASFVARQLVWVVLGLGVMVAVGAVDLRVVRRLIPAAYGLTVLTLVAVLSPLGSSANGAQAWFDFGPLRLQPAELAKPVLVLVLAAHAGRARGGPHGVRLTRGQLLGALAQAVPLVGLVLLQPDLGTAVVLLVITGGMVVVAGARGRHLAVLVGMGVLAVAGVFKAGMVAPYQVDRLTSFLDQSGDPQGATWNLEQAKIAIGSGGLAGAGLFEGSQTALAYVPEQHTDFVFTVVGEELGLLGGLTLLGLFGVMAWRTWRAAWLASDTFGALCCTGVLAMFVFQVFQNMGMTMGITPITGIPLPFLSYGGSSTIASFAAVGLVANVSRCPKRATAGAWRTLGRPEPGRLDWLST